MLFFKSISRVGYRNAYISPGSPVESVLSFDGALSFKWDVTTVALFSYYDSFESIIGVGRSFWELFTDRGFSSLLHGTVRGSYLSLLATMPIIVVFVPSTSFRFFSDEIYSFFISFLCSFCDSCASIRLWRDIAEETSNILVFLIINSLPKV